MPVQQRVAWIAGGAVSAGIGAAVFFGGSAVAAAETPSSTSDTAGADRAATTRLERRSARDDHRRVRATAPRRAAQRVDAQAAGSPNTTPTATTEVDAPDPLTGVTRVAVSGSDADGDELSYTATRPRYGSVTGDGEGGFTYRPKDFWRRVARIVPSIRSDGFSVSVDDGRGGVTSSAVVTRSSPSMRRRWRVEPALPHRPRKPAP